MTPAQIEPGHTAAGGAARILSAPDGGTPGDLVVAEPADPVTVDVLGHDSERGDGLHGDWDELAVDLDPRSDELEQGVAGLALPVEIATVGPVVVHRRPFVTAARRRASTAAAAALLRSTISVSTA